MAFKLTPPQARAAWVAALRSDKYVQGRDYLCSVNGETVTHCCLGVACEVMRAEESDAALTRTMHETHVRYGQMNKWLPTVVREWLGLMSPAGGFAGGSLMNMNDDGKSFATIADLIEQKPDGLVI